MTTLIDVFRSLEARRGEFVIHDDGYRVRRFTYAQVTRAARGFAGRLDRTGLVPGDKMLLWGENSAEWLACYWGAVIAGVIVVPIDYRSSPAFAARVAAIVGAKLICIGADVDGKGELPPFPPGVPVLTFDEFDWAADGPMPDRSITRDDIAQIVFTSGATAEP
jgi:long-chain acyl-CoA synthetase